MANIKHSVLSGDNLHEVKGADSAVSGSILVATGTGSAVFKPVSEAILSVGVVNKPTLTVTKNKDTFSFTRNSESSSYTLGVIQQPANPITVSYTEKSYSLNVVTKSLDVPYKRTSSVLNKTRGDVVLGRGDPVEEETVTGDVYSIVESDVSETTTVSYETAELVETVTNKTKEVYPLFYVTNTYKSGKGVLGEVYRTYWNGDKGYVSEINSDILDEEGEVIYTAPEVEVFFLEVEKGA